MDVTYPLQNQQQKPYAKDATSELQAWFSVCGDTDDFIYFGEPEKPHSEK